MVAANNNELSDNPIKTRPIIPFRPPVFVRRNEMMPKITPPNHIDQLKMMANRKVGANRSGSLLFSTVPITAGQSREKTDLQKATKALTWPPERQQSFATYRAVERQRRLRASHRLIAVHSRALSTPPDTC